MERDSFVFYRSFYEAIKDLDAESFKRIMAGICEYGLNSTLPGGLFGIENTIFTLVRPQLDANNKRFVNGQKGGQYGVLGGAPMGNSNAVKNWDNISKQPQWGGKNNPKTTPNVNVNDNVNDNVNENENVVKKIKKEKGDNGSAALAATPICSDKSCRKKNGEYDINGVLLVGNETEEQKQILVEARNQFKLMRKKKKKPLTDYAERLRVKQLIKLCNDNNYSFDEKVLCINRAIDKCRDEFYKLPDELRSKKEKAVKEGEVVQRGGYNFYIV